MSLQVDNNGVLYAAGSAPHQWIAQAKKLATSFPGVTQIQTKNLVEIELQVQSTKEKLEKQILYFVKGNTQLLPGEDNKLQVVIKEIRTLSNIAPFFHKNVRVEIVGHSDSDGSQQKNLHLSQARANAVISTLVSQGLKISNLTTVGLGSREAGQNHFAQNNQKLNRQVTFKVFLTDASKEK